MDTYKYDENKTVHSTNTCHFKTIISLGKERSEKRSH